MKHSDKRKLAIASVCVAMVCGLVGGIKFGIDSQIITVANAIDDLNPNYISWDSGITPTPTLEGLELSIKGKLQDSKDVFGANIKLEQERLEKVRLEEIEEEEKRQAALEEERLAAIVQIEVTEVVTPYVGETVENSAGTSASITLYGVDCYGCSGQYSGVGGTASGIALDVNQGVLQSNGEWLPGITYDGYYIIAAGPQYAMGTIVEISDHGLAGAGITPGVPFLAIVADRGGAIYGNKFDLYAGSEQALQIYQNGGYGTITIVG